MHVIAIGPQGGKIVGYHHGDIKKPIYAGSDDAKKLEMATPHGSPAASAAGHGVHVGVHPTRHDMATVSWKHGDQGAAKAWLDAHGGAKSLPSGVEVHKTSTHTVMHVPREWAEKGTAAAGQAEITPPGSPTPTAAAAIAPSQSVPTPTPPPVVKPVTPTAVTPTAPAQTTKAIAPPVEVDKASLTVWGCDSWQASGRHPVTTPDGPGFLLGHVHTKMNHDMLTGHMLVEVGGVAKKYVASQVVPQAGAPLQGAWAHPQVKAWSSPEVSNMLDTILAANLTTQSGVSVGTSAATVFDKLAAEGVACFVTGGMVRDAIQGKKGNDIDFGFTGSGAQRLRAVAKKLGLPLAAHSAADLGNGSGLVEFGHDEKTVEEGKAQGKGFTNLGGCLSSTPPPPAIRGSDMYSDLLARDFTCNALSYDPKNKVILDPSGTGVADAASKTLRFAAPPEMWDDWSDRNPSIVARYYKFRSRGYEPADQAHADYIKTKGKALVEQGALPGWAKAELKKYKKEIVADFGLAWFNAHV